MTTCSSCGGTLSTLDPGQYKKIVTAGTTSTLTLCLACASRTDGSKER
jgi:hypothetical protein